MFPKNLILKYKSILNKICKALKSWRQDTCTIPRTLESLLAKRKKKEQFFKELFLKSALVTCTRIIKLMADCCGQSTNQEVKLRMTNADFEPGSDILHT